MALLDPGRTYRLEYKTALEDEDWAPLGDDQEANSASLTFADTIEAGEQLFLSSAAAGIGACDE